MHRKITAKTLVEDALVVDQVVIHSLDNCMYCADVHIGDDRHMLVAADGSAAHFRSLEAAKSAFEGVSVSDAVLRHQSAYDEMIGQPADGTNVMEVKISLQTPHS